MQKEVFILEYEIRERGLTLQAADTLDKAKENVQKQLTNTPYHKINGEHTITFERTINAFLPQEIKEEHDRRAQFQEDIERGYKTEHIFPAICVVGAIFAAFVVVAIAYFLRTY